MSPSATFATQKQRESDQVLRLALKTAATVCEELFVTMLCVKELCVCARVCVSVWVGKVVCERTM